MDFGSKFKLNARAYKGSGHVGNHFFLHVYDKIDRNIKKLFWFIVNIYYFFFKLRAHNNNKNTKLNYTGIRTPSHRAHGDRPLRKVSSSVVLRVPNDFNFNSVYNLSLKKKSTLYTRLIHYAQR